LADRSSGVVSSSVQSAPQRRFSTRAEWSDIQPSPSPAAVGDVTCSMQHYDSPSSGPQDFPSSSQQVLQTSNHCPVSVPDSAGMIARLSDDDYHSPDSAYHSFHGSGTSTTWNSSGQGFDDQLAHHLGWSQVNRGTTYSKNHEKCPSWPVTQTSGLPPADSFRVSSWTDNTATNCSTEFCNVSQTAGGNSHAEDGSAPSPRSARRYFEEVGARLREQQSCSEFPTRCTYQQGGQNNSHHQLDSVHSAENNPPNYYSPTYGKVVTGLVRYSRSPRTQECSPGPPPLPATSPPHDSPPRLPSSGMRGVSSSNVEKLPAYDNASCKTVLDIGRDRELLTLGRQGMPGIRALPVHNVARVESFSRTPVNGSQPQGEQNYWGNTRQCISGSEFSQLNDKLSPRATIDKDDLLSRLDRLPESQRQTSVLRRLTQEYFGDSRSRYGINPTGRMSLGSMSNSMTTSGSDLSQPSVVRGMDTNCQHQQLDSQQEAAGSSVFEPVELPDDVSTNFIRTRKTQMSLRKAFGIFDDFDVAETDIMKQLPIVAEDDVSYSAATPVACNHPAGIDHRVSYSKGRRSSESEFCRQIGDWPNLDQHVEKPSALLMHRSVSVGSSGQMVSAVPHGRRLSTASDAQSIHSSSSGSTNGVKSSLDLSTGSSARSTEAFPVNGVSLKESSDPSRALKAKSKSLPRDALLAGDAGLSMSMSYPQQWHQDDDFERLQVN